MIYIEIIQGKLKRGVRMFRELTRKNKQISEAECVQILVNEKRGVLSVIGENGYPYGTPMNHFYNEEDGKIYFHCGKFGHRLDALKENDKVCFTVYDSGYQDEGDWVYNVKSVIAFGRITIVDCQDKIADIATKLSLKFIQDEEHIKKEIERSGAGTLLLEMSVEHMCGKSVREE